MTDFDDYLDATVYPNLTTPEVFCDHLARFWELAINAKLTIDEKPHNVLLLSAENDEGSSRILANLLYEKCSIPILISTEPSLPRYVNDKTLILAHSSIGIDSDIIYSIEEGLKRNANFFCVTPKGPVADYAKRLKIPLFIIPDAFINYAQKNYLFIPMLASLVRADIIDDHTKDLYNALSMLKKSIVQFAITSNLKDNAAKGLAQWFRGRRVLLVGVSNVTDDMAFCWHQQLLQSIDGLQLEWDILPDFQRGGMAVSLSNIQELLAILLRSEEEHTGITTKFWELENTLKKQGAKVEKVLASGSSRMERTLYLLTLGDFVVAYLKLFRQEKSSFSGSN